MNVGLALRARSKAVIAVACGAAAIAVPLALRSPCASSIEVHVQVPAGQVLDPALQPRPVFSELPPGTHDGRERWQIVDVPPARVAAVIAAADDGFVEPDVSLPSVPARAGSGDASCPIRTPAYHALQGYLGPAPAGIDAPAAWQLGVRGQGEQLADVEGGWNPAHEDLPGARIEHVYGRRMPGVSWLAHGTAVLGEIVGVDNGKGVTGLAPDVDRVFTSSIGGGNVADAIDSAAERLDAGDVLLVELQGTGPLGHFLPVEYWDDAYAAIAAATARGVIVIEAAGNGAEDLDRGAYGRRFDRARRDSGAILVGAGDPAVAGYDDRAPASFTNYGARVDVQGWGWQVATLEYGDLQACDEEARGRHYTSQFAGTSSASPIVASAALLIESAARRDGRVVSPGHLRALLVATGTPQAGDPAKHIGPRPDVAEALLRLSRGP